MLLSDFIREGGSLIGERLGDDDWYVKAQHHGLPTRLLDWTMSPQVALWMALDNATQSEEDGVIIAIVPKVKEEKKEIAKSGIETVLADCLSAYLNRRIQQKLRKSTMIYLMTKRFCLFPLITFRLDK